MATPIISLEVQATPAKFRGVPFFSETASQQGRDGHWESKTITRWAVCVYVDPEDPEEWATAEVVGLPGVASEGRDEDEALANLREALVVALQDLQSGGPVKLRTEYEIPRGGRVAHLTV